MDWKACAVDDLRRYPLMKAGILNCRDRIRAIGNIAAAGRAALAGEQIRHADTRIIDAIVEVDRLKYNLDTAETITTLIERGLSAL